VKLSANAAQALAAAYALGTLRGPARRRLEHMSHADEALASLMRHWESALAPLYQTYLELAGRHRAAAAASAHDSAAA